MCEGKVKGWAYEAHEPPGPRGPTGCWSGYWHGVEEPGPLHEAVYALLAHKLFGFFEELRAQVAHGYFAQQVVFFLKLFHLSITYATVLAIGKVLHHLVPLAQVFLTQRDLHSASK